MVYIGHITEVAVCNLPNQLQDEKTTTNHPRPTPIIPKSLQHATYWVHIQHLNFG